MGNARNSQNSNIYAHPRLGPIKRIQMQNEEQYMQYSVVVEGQRLVNQWEESLKNMRNHKCDNFLLLPLEYHFQKQAMCGAGGTLTIKFQDYMFGLAPQIKNRREIKRPFQQVQIWYLIYMLTSIGTIMEVQQKKIGDIRPQNILINQDGEIKILCTNSWPGNSDNFILLMEDNEQKVFLSPQQCNYRNKKKSIMYPEGLDLNACEVFSMGLTILQASSLKDCSSLYQTQDYKFNQFKIRQCTDQLQNRYSKQLIAVIQEMIRTSPEKRIKCSTIHQILQPHATKIKQFTEFTLQRAKLYEILQADRHKHISTTKSSLANESTPKISQFKNIDRSPRKYNNSQIPTSIQKSIQTQPTFAQLKSPYFNNYPYVVTPQYNSNMVYYMPYSIPYNGYLLNPIAKTPMMFRNHQQPQYYSNYRF